jgi:adenylylsulfate kinase
MTVSFVVWLTGLPASGKSIIAEGLREKLVSIGFNCVVLEGEALRKMLTPHPTYQRDERDFFYRAVSVIAKYLYDNGLNVIIDATGHRRAYRDYARSIIEKFIEVYVYCPIDICIERDKKGLYKMAMDGVISGLPGIQVKYEEPEEPDIKVDTSNEEYERAVDQILSVIMKKILM